MSKFEKSQNPMGEYKIRKLNSFWEAVVIFFTIMGLTLVVNQVFQVKRIFPSTYLYLILGLFLSIVFILYPMKKENSNKLIFYIDYFLFGLTLFICSYFAWHGMDIIQRGWAYHAPRQFSIMAPMLWFLVVEAVRRTSGRMVSLMILLFSFYPIFCGRMPGLLNAIPRSFTATALFHTLGQESIFGVPMTMFAQVIVGFIIFGALLNEMGAGNFFVNIARTILGERSYGGPAKAAVISSAFLATTSGSVISNVITSGSITIPAMKKAGFPARVAGAIELCASTGGPLMPPVMGTAAFLVASVLGVSYSTVIIAAAIPSMLYFFALFIQVDGYARANDLRGFGDDEERPKIIMLFFNTGWIYTLAFIVLTYALFRLPIIGRAPFYAIGMLLVVGMFHRETRLDFENIIALIKKMGILLADIVPVMAGVGMIMGSLIVTGVTATMARELVMTAGENAILLLVMGAAASFVMGMGVSSSVCYILLAVTLAPTLVRIGYNPVATHLFLLYYGILSYITPPVAMGAYPAASIAETDPLATAVVGTRLGGAIYFVPFWFIFEPILLFQDPSASITKYFFVITLAVIGVFLMASALCGHMRGVGNLMFRGKKGIVSYLCRILLFISGILLPVSETRYFALVLAVMGIFIGIYLKGSLRDG